MNAILSPCGQFRYMLQRGECTPPARPCAIVCLNPSTADHTKDDPTSRKLLGFARDWGYTAYDLFNVGAFRATKPEDWQTAADPFGSDNDFYLSLAACYPLIVVAWGNHAPGPAVRRTVDLLSTGGKPLYCLGTNANGSPKHPLYVPYSERLRPWVYT